VDKLTLIAMDTSKHVFTLHGVDEWGNVLLRRELRRQQVEAFFGKLPATKVVLEACGSSHHWGRVLTALGHRVGLIPPQYVKPFVKRSKNDRIDAEAISEAAQRPSMRFVPVKSAEAQSEAMILSVRELLVKQQTLLVNALRGHASEFGVIAAKGTHQIEALLERVAVDPAVPAAAQAMLAELGAAIAEVSTRLAELDRKVAKLHKTNPVSQQLAEVPGIGPISALTLALTIDARQFQSGRHFAAWLGLTPKQNSTGGKHRLGKISRQGNERCANCWCSARPPWSGWSNRNSARAARGCRLWCSIGHARSWPWRWPTRWPVSCGP
jgi:transposase